MQVPALLLGALSAQATYISGGQLVLWRIEELAAVIELDESPGAITNPEECSIVRNAASLGEVVRDDNDRIAPA